MKNYDDIIDLPHHQSTVHTHMKMEERAAQFSPFAALTGHADAIKETARLTDRMIELSEDEKSRLNDKIQIVRETIGSDKIFKFTYFVPDEIKAGGAYLSHSGSVRRIDEIEGIICLNDCTVLELDRIVEIESDCFKHYEFDE